MSTARPISCVGDNIVKSLIISVNKSETRSDANINESLFGVTSIGTVSSKGFFN